jgi:hypothetical protein
MTEPVLGVGDERVYVPDILLTDRIRSMEDMGSLVLRVEWSWLDEQRWLLAPWLRKRSRRTLPVDIQAFVASMHGGPLILECERLAEEVHGVAEQLKTMNDRATRDEMKDWKTPAEVKAAMERYAFSGWLGYQWKLWVSRLKMWTRRRQ